MHTIQRILSGWKCWRVKQTCLIYVHLNSTITTISSLSSCWGLMIMIDLCRCLRAFQRVKHEHEALKRQLETYFQVHIDSLFLSGLLRAVLDLLINSWSYFSFLICSWEDKLEWLKGLERPTDWRLPEVPSWLYGETSRELCTSSILWTPS